MLTLQDKVRIKTVYIMAESETEREETIDVLAESYTVTVMEIRQVLQSYGVYGVKEGKTIKEQYAAALYAVTNIKTSEWMKITLESQKKLMEIMRNG